MKLSESLPGRTIMLLSLLIASCTTEVVAQPSKAQVLRRATAIINRLVHYSIAAGKHHDPDPNVAVERMIGPENDPQVLRIVAVTSRTLSYPGMAEDQYLDQFLDAATWVALGRIGKIPGERADEALIDFKELTRLDGGSALAYESVVDDRARKLGIPEASLVRMKIRPSFRR